MNASTIIERLKLHPMVKSADTPVGVFSATCKGVELDESDNNNDITAIITTDDVDLDDEVIAQNALDFKYLTANAQLFVDHRYDTLTHTAGFLRAPLGPYPDKRDPRGWKARIRLYDNDAGNAIKELVKQSGQIGLSIGFYPTDYGPLTEDEMKRYGKGAIIPSAIIRSARVFEFSFTALPCNVNCQGNLTMGNEKQATMMRDMRDSGLIRPDIAETLGLMRDEKIKLMTDNGVVERVVSA